MPESTKTRPTAPGWYWTSITDSPVTGGNAWKCVHVVYNCWDVKLEPEGGLGVCDIDHRFPIDISDCAFDSREWLGPITPDDVVELERLRAIAHFAKGNTLVELTDTARLQAAGDALVAVAKEAACALEGEANTPLRGRLCDAIAGWLILGIHPREGHPTGD